MLKEDQKILTTAALCLYWGEGAKSLAAGVVDIANSEPAIPLIFLKYLREIVRVDEKRLRVYLYCFEDQDVEKLRAFWSATLKIPLEQFTKPYIRKRGVNNGRVMEYGVVHIRYSDKKLLCSILDQIKAIHVWADSEAVKHT